MVLLLAIAAVGAIATTATSALATSPNDASNIGTFSGHSLAGELNGHIANGAQGISGGGHAILVPGTTTIAKCVGSAEFQQYVCSG